MFFSTSPFLPYFPLFFLQQVFFCFTLLTSCAAVDEETRAEFEEMQKSSPLAQNPAAQLQNFDLASFLAGKTNDQPQQSSQGGGSGSKKRG